jgi:hypothetical protein
MQIPTADTMARIIIEAARATHADPLDIDGGRDPAIGRARQYAALAVLRLFPDFPTGKIGALVGKPHPPYAAIIQRKAVNGGLPWFNRNVLDAICEAAGPIDVPAFIAHPAPAPAQPRGLLSDPDAADPDDGRPKRRAQPSRETGFARPKIRADLERELRQAVLNTAAMQQGDDA